MKIICDCGAEVTLRNKPTQDEMGHYTISLVAGYECVIITCGNCGEEIVIGGEPTDGDDDYDGLGVDGPVVDIDDYLDRKL